MALNIDFEEIQETLNNLDPENVGSWPNFVKNGIFLAVFVGFFVAGNYLFVGDQQAILKSKVQEEVTLLQEFEKKSFQAANLDEFRKQMEDLDHSYGALLRQLPRDTEVPGLLEDITHTGLGSGLKFESIDLGAEEEVDFYAVLPIDLKVIGGFHGLAGFMSGVAALPRIVTLHDFEITDSKQGSTGNKLMMTVEAKTYRYKKDDEDVAPNKVGGR